MSHFIVFNIYNQSFAKKTNYTYLIALKFATE